MTWQWHKFSINDINGWKSYPRGFFVTFSLIPFRENPLRHLLDLHVKRRKPLLFVGVAGHCGTVAQKTGQPGQRSTPVEHAKMCGLYWIVISDVWVYHGLSPIYLWNLLLLFKRPNSWGRVCPFMTRNGSCRDTGLLKRKVEEHGHHRFGSRTAGTKVKTHKERLFLRTTP